MEGIFIPKQIAVLEELDGNEKMVLSIYKYYTQKGKYHCCTLTNEEIGKEIGRSKRQIIRIKNHLKELGFIRIIGIKVYYEECHSCHSKGDILGTEECHSCHSKGDTVVTHNKENKNKKEKKEEKETKNNFDQALNNLSDYYKTTEKIEYLKSNYGEYINKINSIDDDLSIDSISKNIKNAIIKKFGVEPIEVIDIEKKESICHSIEEIVENEVSKDNP